MKRIFTSLVMVLAFALQSQAQLQTMNSACEQNPCNALPVCATTVTNPYSYQSNTGNPGVAATGCGNSIGGTIAYVQNWVYYRFTCQTPGTLNFTITPNDPSGDLDWAMWNITNSGCGGIATGNLVECNSFPGLGGTGMQAIAAQAFEPQVNLVAGNTYIIGISRRAGGTSTTPPSGPPFATGSAGFSINFGGTANIINNTAPALQSILPYDPCLPVTQLKLKLTQPVRCFQIGASDFSFTGGGPVPAFSATGGVTCPGCTGTTGFNYSNITDTVTISFSSPLPAGSYTVSLVGVNPFSTLCGTPANTAITLPLTVSANLRDSIRTGFSCATLTYVDTVLGVNGVSPYQYKSQGFGQSNTYGAATASYNIFSGLQGGNTYTFTVKDASGCTADTVVTHAPYIPLGITTFKKDPPCTNQFTKDTFRVVNTNGGAAPFTYALTSTPASASATAIQYAPGAWNNLQQGSFTITCTDKWGCTATAVANIANPPVVTFPTPTSTNPQCFGDSSGIINVNAQGGTGAMSYTINPNPPTVVLPPPGYFTQQITGLPGAVSPGITYTITVADANGCTATNTRILTTPAALNVSTAAATRVNPTCTNPCGGSYSPVASGGTGGKKYYRLPLVTPPNTYTDSVVTTGGSFLNLCQGTYTIRCVDVLGCNTTVTVTLTLPPVPDIVNNSVTNVTCFGLCNGQILNTTTGGTTPYTYSITPSNNPPCGNAVLFGTGGDYQNLPAGTYKVVVTSPNQCKDSVENIVITQPAAITWNSVTQTNILCFGNNTGTIAVNATGGNGSLNYSINPLGPQFGPSGNFNNLTAQQYTVTASDANACSTTTMVLITQPADLVISSATFTAPSCNGLSDGTITVVTTGGTPTNTYSIAPNPASNNTGLFTGLPAATYTITVTDGNGCSKSSTLIMTQPAPIAFTSATFVSPLCFGDANGTIAVATSGGVSPKTYTINPSGPQSNSTGNFTGLTAQQYTVTVTDNNTCTNQTTINVVQPSQVNFLSLGFTQPSCGGNSNGTITASASGGTGTKTYSLLPAVQPSNTTGSFTGITAQTYTVTATDVNGCTTTSSVTVTEPTPLLFTSGNFTQPLCFNGTNGTISVTTSGGTGQKTYTINPLGPQSNTTGNFSNIAFGSYTITAVDINGCSNTTVVSVTQPTQLTIASASFVQPSCNGGNNGTATVSASGGTAGYTYTITPLGPQSNITGNFAGLSAQCYTITATDVNGCTKTTTVCVTQPTVVVASVTGTTSPTCTPGCDGTITVNGAGGTPTYTATINPSLTQSPALTFTGACATTNYIITVSDANGCTGTTSTTLAVPSSPTPAAATVTNASCNGSCNGTAQVTIVAGITYTIAPINPGQNFNTTTGAVTGLCAGTYTITATNALACTGTVTFTINQPTVLTLAINTSTNPTCVPANNGTATVTAAGGNGTNVYSIAPTVPSGSINATTGNASNLAPGVTYIITVTDVKGCTSTTSITPATPVAPTFNSATFTQPLCFGNNNGTITASATGVGPVTYTITPLGPQSNTTGNFSNLTAQSYTVTATTSNGCTATTIVVVTEPVVLAFASSSFTQPSCFGLNDGTASVVATGGTTNYSYTITPLGPQTNNTGNFNNLTAQCYTVTVTDANNCTKTTTFCVTQPTAVAVSVTGTNSPTCTPGCDGSITVSTSGGTNPITTAINPFLTASPANTFINACAATNYVITATDGNGCTASTSTTLSTPNAPTPAAATVTNVSCNGQCNGTAQVTIVAGITYTIAPINPGQNFNTTTGAVTGLCAGTYTVTATNALACVGTVSFTITQPPVLTLAINTTTDPTCVPSNNGTATVTSTGGNGTNVYSIAPTVPSGSINATTGNATNLAPGQTYTITVTDVKGCTSTTTITPATPVGPTFNSATFTQPLCNGNNNGTITVSATGSPTYTISPLGPQSNVTGNFSNLTAQSYTITATTANGCTATTIVVVTEPAVLAFASSSFTQPSCFGLNDGTATVVATGGTTGYSYTITPLGPQTNNTGNFGNLTAQCYTVTVTDANACTKTTTFCVTQPTAVAVSVTGTTSPTCTPGCDGSITVSTSGGTNPITTAINPFLTASPANTFINACAATNYVITATDANGCSASTSTTLSTPNAPTPAAATVTNVSCNGQCNGTAQVTIVAGITYTIAPINPGQNFNTTTGAVTGLCAGTYIVTATNALSCVGTVSFTITEPPVLTLAINTTTDPTCVPSNNGTATVTSTGGNGTNVYSIAPTVPSGSINATTGNASNLAPGVTYIITVTDVKGCTSTATHTPATPVGPTFNSATFTQPLCNGNNNGSITVSATGSPTYTITPLGPQSNTTGNFSNLTAQSYTVTATTANGCTANTIVVVTQPAVLAFASSSFTQPSCNSASNGPSNNGTITVAATGGTTAYTYTITPLGPQSNSTGTFSNLTAQCYTITVTDANNCTKTTTVCVTQPTAVAVSVTGTTSPTCTPGCDGSITVSATGGTGTPTLGSAPFLTQSPANTFINACAATNYVITATDGNGCTASTSTTLTTPNAPTPAVTGTVNATCNGACDGSAQVTIVPGITYAIAPVNPGQNFNTTTGAVTGLCAGTYTVTATNALSCVGTVTFTITQPNAVALTITGAVNPTSPIVCNGSAQANGSGGTGTITYTISAPGVINANTGAISALCDGCYTVTATDINGCTNTASFCVAAAVAVLTPNISNIANATCFNTCNGTAQAGAVGGVQPYTYSIAPTVPSGAINANTGAITGLCAGTVYTVTVTDAVSTSATITVTVTQPTQVNITLVSTTQASCNPTCNAVAVVSANGGTPTYTYAIAPAAGITQNPVGTFTGLCAGTAYVITTTDVNGCTSTTSVNITTVAAPTPAANVLTNVTCFGLCNGTAQVTTVPGVTYTVAGPGTPAINAAGAISALCAGTYTVTATNAGNCTGTVTFSITQPTQLTLALNSSSNPTCNPGCDGTASFTAAGGVGTNVYSIAPASGTINASNGNASTLCAGTTYTVTVTNANGCTATATVLLTVPASPVVNITSTTPPSCVPGCDGGATTTAVPGGVYSIAPITGSINASTGIASNLCANITYTITVANASNCTAQTTVTLTTPGSPTVTIANTTTPSCVPGCDGTATPNPQAGLTYTILPLATINASTGAASGLCAGTTYTIKATDANGCTGQTTVLLNAPVPTPINIVSSTQPNCVPGCNGTATPTSVVGAVYTIAPSGSINSNTGVASNLCAGITYTITATTANGCSANTTILLNAPANPTVNMSAVNNPSGPVNCDGTAQATGAGGLAPYTYAVAGTGSPVINVNTGAMSNLCGACYTVTVTDANGCTGTTTVCLTNPLVVTAVGTNVSCFGVCNGTGQATAQGGSQSGYTYAITGGATINSSTGAISNLCAGTIYTITATDLNSTTATTTLQISGPTQINFNAATTTSPTCIPGCDGTIAIAANGGTPGYTYTLASPAGMNCTPTQATPGNFGNLGAGTYTVTVTDANGCTKTSTVVVTPSGVPVINSVTGTNPLCNNQCNGTIVTNAVGATSYTLLPGNTTNATGSFNGLCAGTYTVTASNVAGCTVTATVILANPSVLTVNTTASTNAPCFGLNGGTITYNVTGGTGPITYTSNPALAGVGGVYPNVGAGTYTITAADVNGCSVSHVFTITQPTGMAINSVSVASPLCSNQSNGVITLNVSGGTGLYTATTNPPSTSVGPGASPIVITGLSPLTYTVTVSDANNCTITSSVTVPGSVPIVINSVNVTQPLCNATCNGIITVAATGGNGTLTYTINPAGPASNTTGIFNSLCGGTYTVTVTDVNACTQTASATITPPAALTFTSVSSTNPLCFGNNNGTITVTAAGGTGLPVYSITPASNQPTPGNFTGLTAQTYTVVVTDANLCSTSTTITLTNPAQLVWNNPTSTNVSCFGGSNGSITAPALGGTGTKTYSINPAVQASNITGSFSNLTAQCYTITVADVQGCTLSSVICITQPPALTFNAPTVVNVLCFGAATGSISISANGGTPTYTYALTPANGTQATPGVFENLLAGSYVVTVTDANGCTASTSNILISQPPAITFTSVNVQDVACFGDATGSISVTAQGGVGAIQFNLQPSGNQASPGFFSGLYAGTYTVSAVDGNNCVVTTVVTVGSNPQLVLNSVTLTEPICFGDNNGAIAATAVGGVAPIQYSLNNSPFQNNGTFNNLYAGYYIMTLRDAIGCMEDTLINLTQPTEVGAKVETTAANCVDSRDGKVTITGTGGRGGYKYYLSPGLYINKSGVFSGLAIGTYTLRVVDTAGCEYRNVFNINPPANPLNNYMTKQDLACFGRGNEGQATANVAGGTPPYNFLWNTSPVQTTATASTLYFGLYKVQITDANGCQIKDSVYISEGPCCDVAFIPNAFSPNGDGNNDEFRILTSAGVELQQLEIYNRWGQRVWSSNSVQRAWNGYIDGQEAPMDTYYYVFRYKCTRDNENYTKKGDVILVR